MSKLKNKQIQKKGSWGKRFLAAAAVMVSTNLAACTYNIYTCKDKTSKNRVSQKTDGRYETAMKILAKHKPVFSNIFTRALKRDPTLRGKLEVTLKINKCGSVENVQFKGEMNEEIYQRFRMLFKRIKFPSSDQSTTLKFPIVLVASHI
jgi:hypothetical protein